MLKIRDINRFLKCLNQGKCFRIEATTDKNVEQELYTVISPYNDEKKLLEKQRYQ